MTEMFHTYVKHDTTYVVGHFVVRKPDGVQDFVPLFDVASAQAAIRLVGALNGNGASLAGIAITKEYMLPT
jgi:hypothetical protein